MALAHEQHVEPEYARQTLAREYEADTIGRLRSERDELRGLIAIYPSRSAELIRHHEHEAAQALGKIARALTGRERLRAEWEQMGRWQRRGERGRSVAERLDTQERLIDRMKHRQEIARAEVERLRSGPDSPERWAAQHPKDARAPQISRAGLRSGARPRRRAADRASWRAHQAGARRAARARSGERARG